MPWYDSAHSAPGDLRVPKSAEELQVFVPLHPAKMQSTIPSCSMSGSQLQNSPCLTRSCGNLGFELLQTPAIVRDDPRHF
jgi:hypothetical protein